MFNKKPVLRYESVLKEHPNPIGPAKSFVPEWYKKIPKWENGELISGTNINATVKQCMPFIDSLTVGYMITMPHDIYVKEVNGSPFITWKSDVENPPRWRDVVAHKNIVPHDHYPFEYTWNTCIALSVPEGYSMLITHPLNRHDLPFTTISGVIDGGYELSPHGNLPFYIKRGFEGVIEQGTPIMQVIPFRQESWSSEDTIGLAQKGVSNTKAANLVFSGWYKKNFWNRKEYL